MWSHDPIPIFRVKVNVNVNVGISTLISHPPKYEKYACFCRKKVTFSLQLAEIYIQHFYSIEKRKKNK